MKLLAVRHRSAMVAAVVVPLVAVAWATLVPAAGAAAAARPTSFSGSASALGFRATLTIPGFPIADSPIDGGGPTAQAALDSLGNSIGYAAFPDPGPIAVAVPGLVAGLLAGGAAGLPPIPLPQLPPYPLAVTATPGTGEQTVGDEPYLLTADSLDTGASGRALLGVAPSGVGRTAVVESVSRVAVEDDGVVATAEVSVEGLTLGPLSIGEVRSSATQRLDSTGTVASTSTLVITGLRLGGLTFDLTPEGLSVAGAIVPLPVADLLTSVMDQSGITFEFLPSEEYPDRVVSPAVRITMPIKNSGLGTGDGNLALTLGYSTAMVSAAVPGAVAPPPAAAAPNVSVSEPLALGGRPVAAAPLSDSGGALVAAVPATSFDISTFEVDDRYLVVVGGALAVLLVGRGIRFLEGERRWTSVDG